MASIARAASRKVFERNLQNYEPKDPLYETYVDSKGRERRRKVRTVRCGAPTIPAVSLSGSLRNSQREIPPGLSKRDAKILKSVQRRAHYLDKGFSLCGFRFGWTFVIGMLIVV